MFLIPFLNIQYEIDDDKESSYNLHEIKHLSLNDYSE